MRLKKGDMIIIVILVLAAVSWLGINRLSESEDQRQAVIEIDGNIYERVPIDSGMKQLLHHIELDNGNHIDIVVDESGAYVKEVVCPDKVCKKTGIVSKVGQSIVCLPNKVIVYIEGKTESEIDDISF